jgi:hypothetical protein
MIVIQTLDCHNLPPSSNLPLECGLLVKNSIHNGVFAVAFELEDLV